MNNGAPWLIAFSPPKPPTTEKTAYQSSKTSQNRSQDFRLIFKQEEHDGGKGYYNNERKTSVTAI